MVMERHKRKRDDEDGMLVTFYAPDRAFSRVFKGQSLEETRELVRNKLGLRADEPIRFARVHEGKYIELDDEDDFEAFCYLSRHTASIDVSVYIGEEGPRLPAPSNPQGSKPNPNASQKRKRKLKSALPASFAAAPESRPGAPGTVANSGLVLPTAVIDVNGAPKQKRKRKTIPAPVEPPEPTSTVLCVEPPPNGSTPIPIPGQLSNLSSGVTKPFSSLRIPSSSESRLSRTSNTHLRDGKRRIQEPVNDPLTDVAGPSEPSPTVSSAAELSSSVRKKRKKTVPEASETVVEPLSSDVNLKDKRGKRKPKDASVEIPSSGNPNTQEKPVTVEIVNKVGEEKVSGADVEESTATNMGSRTSKKRKRDVAPPPNAREPLSAVAVSASRLESAPPGAVETPAKEKKRRKARQSETNADSPVATVDSVSSTVDETLPSAALKEKRSKSKGRKVEQLVDVASEDHVPSPIATGGTEDSERIPNKDKKSRKKQHHSAEVVAESSSATSTAKDVVVPADHVTSTDSLTKKVVARQDPSEEMMAAVMAAFQSVQSRQSLPASASANRTVNAPTPLALSTSSSSVNPGIAPSVATVTPTPQSTPEVPPSARKRKAGKSKLSQIWGPHDLAEDDSASKSAASLVTAINKSYEPATAVSPEGVQTSTRRNRKSVALIGAKSCRVCEKGKLHPLSQCPIILAGPVSIRKRLAALKKAPADSEVLTQLEEALRDIEQKRSGLFKAPVGGQPSMTTESTLSKQPSSPSLPREKSVSSPLRRPSLSHRSVSSPRLPAGSEISEVAVESRDEGSSNESSSSDNEDEPAPATQSSAVIPDPTNLESILWGPPKPRKSILEQLASSSDSSSSENDDEDEEVREDFDPDEEDKSDAVFRRISRRFQREGSTSDEGQQPEAEQDAIDDEDDDGMEPGSPPAIADAVTDNSIDTADARQVEDDVLLKDDSAIVSSGVQSSSANTASEVQTFSSHEGTESERETNDGSKLLESHVAISESSVPDTNTLRESAPDADRRVEDTPEVDALTSGPPPAMDGHVGSDKSVVQDAGSTVQAQDPHEDASSTDVDMDEGYTEPKVDAAIRGHPSKHLRELSPELGEAVQPSKRRTASSENHQGEDAPFNSSDVRVHVTESGRHAEDPTDPIESYSSAEEKPDPVDDDPIEDSDDEHDRTPILHKTPPPMVTRTPGTVSRMRDRHGRLSAVKNSTTLSQQILFDLRLSQGLNLPQLTDDGFELDPELRDESEKQQELTLLQDQNELEPGQESGHDGGHQAVPDEPEDVTQEVEHSAAELKPEPESRPRRTTRSTRRTSLMLVSSSQPEPEATPAAAPTPTPVPAPRRRGVRLTDEERAQRDAEKVAERERKAAEKKAAKEAKEAAKQAEKEAKAAARVAAKEEKEAARRVSATRGGKRGARGRGGAGKPVSTQSRRSVVSPESEDVASNGNVQEEAEQSHTASKDPETSPGNESKISWATLQQTPQTESVGEADSSMTDELHPSSPEPVTIPIKRPRGRPPKVKPMAENNAQKDAPEVADEQPDDDSQKQPLVTPTPKARWQEPLFFPSSSQMPETPFAPPGGLAQSTPFPAHAHAPEPAPDAGEGNDGDDHDQTFMAPPRRPPAYRYSQSLYPTLTELSSQQLFQPPQLSSPVLQNQNSSVNPTPDRHEDEDADSDSSSDDDASSSDTDAEGVKKAKSHIPEDRRAGAGVQKKKKSGLLSFFT